MRRMIRWSAVMAATLFVCAFVGTGPYAAEIIVIPGMSIQDAIGIADPGDTITVQDGTFVENITIEKPLTLRSANGANMTYIQAVNTAAPVIEVLNTQNVIIEGFSLFGATNSPGSAIYCYNSSAISILNNRCGYNLSQTNYDGINIVNSTNCLIRGNDCQYNQRYGIYVYGQGSHLIDANFCYENTWGLSFYNSANNAIMQNRSQGGSAGFQLRSSLGNRVIDNEFWDNLRGISVREASGQNLFANNYIWRSFNEAVYLENGCNNNRFYFNDLMCRVGGTNVFSDFASNLWVSPDTIWYAYNDTLQTHLLGNYYNDHDLTDDDGDGITNTAYVLPGIEPADANPLADRRINFDQAVICVTPTEIAAVETWRILSNLSIGRRAFSSGRLTINGTLYVGSF